MKYCAIMRYCAIISSSEMDDGPKGLVPQNEISTPKCNPKSTIFHGQTLIKFNFATKLVPQLSINTPNLA